MHEFHIARNILNSVLKQAEKNNLSKIDVIRVEVGELVALTQDSLQFSFEQEAKGSIAENAKIEMKEIEGKDIKIINFDGE